MINVHFIDTVTVAAWKLDQRQVDGSLSCDCRDRFPTSSMYPSVDGHVVQKNDLLTQCDFHLHTLLLSY